MGLPPFPPACRAPKPTRYRSRLRAVYLGAVNEPAVLPEADETLRSVRRIDLRRNFARLPL